MRQDIYLALGHVLNLSLKVIDLALKGVLLLLDPGSQCYCKVILSISFNNDVTYHYSFSNVSILTCGFAFLISKMNTIL